MWVKAITEQRWGQNCESFSGLRRHERDFGEEHAPDSTAKAWAVSGVRVVPGANGTGERPWAAEESCVWQCWSQLRWIPVRLLERIWQLRR